MPFPVPMDFHSYHSHSLILRYSEQAFIPNSAYIIDVIVTAIAVLMLITMMIRKWRFSVLFLSFNNWVELNKQIVLSGSQESLTLLPQSPMLLAAQIKALSVITPPSNGYVSSEPEMHRKALYFVRRICKLLWLKSERRLFLPRYTENRDLWFKNLLTSFKTIFQISFLICG